MSATDRSLAQALGYVDECLEANERGEFELRLTNDPDLAARVEQWRRQNEAIRRIFDETWRSRAPRNKPQHPLDRLEVAAAVPVARLQVEPRETRDFKTRSPRRVAVNKSAEGSSPSPSFPRRVGRGLAFIAFGFLAWAASVVPAPVDRVALLTASAFSTYRTFATRPLDLATAEPAVLERWLRTQVDFVTPIPDFVPGGFTLVGGRVVAGAQGPAAFALYQNSAGRRVSLFMERGEPALDSRIPVQSSGDLKALALTGFGPVDEVIVANIDDDALSALQRLTTSSARAE